MQKSGIKSFIFSFALALCAVVAVDKSLLHAQKAPEEPKNISYKNISLFAKETPVSTIAQNVELSSNKDMQIESVDNQDSKQIYSENYNISAEENKQIQQSTIDTTIAEKTLMSDADDFMFNPDSSDLTNPDMSFEEVLALADKQDTSKNLEQKDQPASEENIDYSIDQNITIAETAENKNINSSDGLTLADTSFDQSINLWLPLEKGKAPIDLASSSSTNQVAMSSGDVMMKSIVTNEDKLFSEKNYETSSDMITNNSISSPSLESPWVVAKGAKFTKNRQPVETVSVTNSVVNHNISDGAEKIAEASDVSDLADGTQALAQDVSKKPEGSVDVAYKVMKNILIPIPEDILQDDNLTPQLVSSDEEKDNIKSDEKASAEDGDDYNEESMDDDSEESVTDDKKEKKGFFSKIGAFFTSGKKNETSDDNYEEYDLYIDNGGNVSKQTRKKANKQKGERSLASDSNPIAGIMPKEMRLSFQPNRAEISGSTLHWLRAFAANSRFNENVHIEIRIDGSNSFELQQKRLNLLYKVFIENGVPYERIDTVFTSREPNSFVIRNINVTSERKVEQRKEEKPTYYQSW